MITRRRSRGATSGVTAPVRPEGERLCPAGHDFLTISARPRQLLDHVTKALRQDRRSAGCSGRGMLVRSDRPNWRLGRDDGVRRDDCHRRCRRTDLDGPGWLTTGGTGGATVTGGHSGTGGAATGGATGSGGQTGTGGTGGQAGGRGRGHGQTGGRPALVARVANPGTDGRFGVDGRPGGRRREDGQRRRCRGRWLAGGGRDPAHGLELVEQLWMQPQRDADQGSRRHHCFERHGGGWISVRQHRRLLDERSRLERQSQWDTSKFPSGIPSLATYVHGKGLKLGIYESPCHHLRGQDRRGRTRGPGRQDVCLLGCRLSEVRPLRRADDQLHDDARRAHRDGSSHLLQHQPGLRLWLLRSAQLLGRRAEGLQHVAHRVRHQRQLGLVYRPHRYRQAAGPVRGPGPLERSRHARGRQRNVGRRGSLALRDVGDAGGAAHRRERHPLDERDDQRPS